jgi:hypothetical protein
MTKSKTKEEFINKAVELHGDKYDYSKVQYKKAIDKIIIICKKHGEFLQQSNLHLMGSGCVKCFRDRNALLQRSNINEFISKAIDVHGNTYDYSKVEYIKSNEKVIIICKEHGDFLQSPCKHLQGGCKLCGFSKQANTRSKSKEEFIIEAIEIHGDIYDYSKVEYKNNMCKVIIICKEHGDFLQVAGSHLQGHGCKKCSTIITANKQRGSTEEFISKAIKIHGNTYNYSKVEYINSIEKIKIICNEHGEFLQDAKGHIQKKAGCPKCGIIKQHNKLKLSNEIFITKAREKHGDTYDYSKVNYGENGRINVVIICKTHGKYLQKPQDHLSGCGCPKCAKRKYSNISILYLDFIAKLYNIKIQHGKNSNEFKIPNSKFKADGHCEETNTIYEFHGTIYHGDPRCCNPVEYNYFGKNYGELYKKTLEREQLIRDLGYNLVIMWEHDWNNINKSIKILQRKFRSNR